MAKIRFDLRLPEEAQAPPDLPIEISKPNMVLVARTLSSQAVELEPGTYYVSARLPAGHEVFRRVRVEGDPATVRLELAPAEAPAAELPSPEHFLLRRLRAASQPEERLPRPLGFGLAGPTGWEPAPARLRLFAGNVLADRPRPEPRWPAPPRAEGETLLLGIPGRDVPLLVQLLQPGLPPLNVALPAWEGVQGSIVLTRSSAGQGYSLAVRLSHGEAELLLGYQRSGLLREAEAATGSASLQAESLLQSKLRDPVAAAVGAYALLRFGDMERLHDWTENLRQWFPGLPDGAAIRGEHLACLGRHREALQSFLELPRRGLPLFSHGLSFTIDRLRLYTGAGRKSFEPEEMGQAARLLKRLHPFMDSIDFGNPVTTFTGLDPSKPDGRRLQGFERIADGVDVQELFL